MITTLPADANGPSLVSPSPLNSDPVTPQRATDTSLPRNAHWIELTQQWQQELRTISAERHLSLQTVRGRAVRGIAHEADLIRMGSHKAERCLILCTSTHGIKATLHTALATGVLQSLRSLPDGVALLIVSAFCPDSPPWPALHLRQRQPLEESPWSSPLLANAEALIQRDQQAMISRPVRHPRSENPVWDEITLEAIHHTHLSSAHHLVHLDITIGMQPSGHVDILSNSAPGSSAFTRARRMFTQFPCSESLHPVYAKHDIEPIFGPAALVDTTVVSSVIVEMGAFESSVLLSLPVNTIEPQYRSTAMIEHCLGSPAWINRAQSQIMTIVTDALEYLSGTAVSTGDTNA